MSKTLISILKVLNKYTDKILGAKEVSKKLKIYGVNLSERTVRYHLKILDENGYTKVYGKFGRKITDKGRLELAKSSVSDKIGFVISRIEALSYLSSFDVKRQNGNVVVNVSFFSEGELSNAKKIMNKIFSSPHIMSRKVVLRRGGEKIGDVVVPKGKIGFGTICSVTINAIFLKAGIPLTSKFGGILEVKNMKPLRFLSLISYEGTSLDPHEIFIKSRMTDVTGAVKKGSGKILASFREIPVVTIDRVNELNEEMKKSELGGILQIGNPNQSLLDIPVGIDKAGVIVVGGLNPIAALEEEGITTESKTTSILFEYSDLVDFDDI